MTGLEKRRSERSEFRQTLELELSAVRETDALSVRRAFGLDISSGGMAMVTDVALAEGEIVRLLDPKSSAGFDLPVFAEVRWAVPANGHWRAGLRFLM
ncbi:MAG: hypothetical protein A2521_10975 [Deltaproteobacteria bacterium RIFOXYD12_FULL_57_12]|nr:MAG: hypothetical protein A2521_10975 [Deltaproteobacteria bacterium RIFOXYD12_FULL_57_12]